MIINLIIIILIKPIKNCIKMTNWKTTKVIQFLDKSYFSKVFVTLSMTST